MADRSVRLLLSQQGDYHRRHTSEGTRCRAAPWGTIGQSFTPQAGEHFFHILFRNEFAGLSFAKALPDMLCLPPMCLDVCR